MTDTFQLAYAVVTRAKEGEKECGDQYLVKKLKDAMLIAIVDGLGHGEHAAFAAKKAICVLKASRQESLVKLMQECHESLKNTRGAVMSLAYVTNISMSWLGVGNVIGTHWKIDDNRGIKNSMLNSSGGIVGMNLPQLKPATFDIGIGDTLIIATDGILPEFTSLRPMPYDLPQTIAQEIFDSWQNKKDDSLVFVARLTLDEEKNHEH